MLARLDVADVVRDLHGEASAMRNASRGSTDRRIDVTPLEPGKHRRDRAVDPNWAFRPSGTKERAAAGRAPRDD